MSSFKLHALLCNAAELGNSTLIPKLKARFGHSRFEDYDTSFMNLLNGDGPVLDWGLDTPLELAVRGGHYPTVEALLDAGADPDAAGNSDPSPIEIAAESGNFDIVRLLIKRSAVRSSPTSCDYILRLLIESSDKSLYVEWLNNVLDDGNLFSLLSYIGIFGEREVYECLDIVSERVREQLNSLRNNTPRSCEPFLRSVLTKSDRSTLQDFFDEDEETGRGRGLELILDVFTGVHVEQQARGILRAALLGPTRAMNEILDPPEISELPTLHILVSRNAPNALGVFLDLGPNLAALDTEGNTALHVAASWNRVACARLLMKFGIKVYTENKDGKTAYQIASEKGYREFGEEMEPFLHDLHFDLPRASLHSQPSF